MAKCRNPFYPIRKRDALQKFPKRHAIAVSVQSHQKEALLHVIHNPPNKGNKPSEKVRFVDDDNVEPNKLCILDFIQGPNLNARSSPIIVRDDVVFIAIPTIACMFDNKNTTTNADVTRDDAENTRRLARKHRANDEVKRHLLKTCAS